MLGALRSKKNNPIIVFLLGLVVLLMAGFGVSVSGRDSGPWAAKVEGESIPYPDYARAYAQAFRTQQQRDRGYDRARAEAENLRQKVLDEMVGTKLMAREAARRGLVVDDETLRSAILDIPSFRNESGSFDPDIYERAVRSMGSHPLAFESELREEILANQLLTLLRGAGPSDLELKERWLEDETKLTLSFVKVPADGFAAQVGTVTQADVDAWTKSVESPEKAVEDHYKRYKSTRYDVPKQVCARHILIKSPKDTPPDLAEKNRARIAEAAKKVASGEMSFAQAAEAYSEDSSKSKGGDLGCFGPGQMVPPFETAAFGLEPGKLSDVVETLFGLHVIQVYDVKDPVQRKLEEVEAEIRRELAELEKAKSLAKAHAEKVLAEAQAKGGLQAAVDALAPAPDAPPTPRLAVEDTEPFTRAQRFIPKLGSAEGVAKVAWTLSAEAPLPGAPIAVEDGFLVVAFKSRETPADDAFAEGKKPLAYRLIVEKQGALYDRLMAEMRARARVEVNPVAVSYDEDLRQRVFQR